jgi:hypothetical protein
MRIDLKDLNADVSVFCTVGQIPIPRTYESIGYMKVTGTYKAGSAGRPDAEHIVGMTAYAQARFHHRRWLFDLSELSYVWGDEMDWVLEWGCGNQIVATVVGPKCMEAISTLGSPQAKPQDCLKDEATFATLGAAYKYLRKQKTA